MAIYRIKIGKSTVETDTASVEIGTHSSCAVHVEDRVASPHHARITRAGAAFELEDLGSATGTWQNGVEVKGRVALTAGDAIVAGCSRVTVGIGADGAIELTVDPKAFFFEPSSSHKDEQGVLKVGGDGERLVRDEVQFGRFSKLGLLNRIAVAVAALLLVWLAVPSGRGTMLEPGSLAAAHERLFTGTKTSDMPAWLAAHHDLAHAEGCSACHDTFGGTPPEKCASCHATLLAQNHPFHGDRSAAAATAGIVLDEDVCASCHLDHSGAKPADGTFIPGPAELAASCARCHADGTPVVTRRPTSFADVPHELVYDRFPHAAHAEQDCAICHVRDESALALGRDFAPVAFQRCMDCHSADALPTENNSWGRDPALADHAARVKPEHQVRLTWHGSDVGPPSEGSRESRCLDCHAEVHGAALRESVVAEPESLSYTLKRRAHADLFAADARVAGADGQDRGCIECHASGSPVHAGETLDGLFWHEVHMSGLRPDGDAASDALSDVCAQCHTDIASATRLAGLGGSSRSYTGPAFDSCAECHREEKAGGFDPLVLAAKPAGSITERRRIDFPHAPHVRAQGGDGPLAAGCFACHSFQAGESAFESVPFTHSDAASCLSCHYDHEHVGGAGATGCALCHPDDAAGVADPVWSGKKTIRMRADTPGFSHWSRGHAADTDAKACTSCHAGVENARTVSEVPIPSEAESACFDCHVRDRFHWRGSPAAGVSGTR